MTPFEARMFVFVTRVVRLRKTRLPRTDTRTEAPLTVLTRLRLTTFPAVRRPFAKAALVGAKTVYLPDDSVSASPAFCTRPTSVENWGSDAATCTMVLSDCALDTAANETAATAARTRLASIRFTGSSFMWGRMLEVRATATDGPSAGAPDWNGPEPARGRAADAVDPAGLRAARPGRAWPAAGGAGPRSCRSARRRPSSAW